MINKQPAEPPTFQKNGELDVIKYWRTIQGEGPNIGEPSVFVRLAGCNLRCKFCDTQYTEGRSMRGVDVILCQIAQYAYRENGNHIKLVVLTGGEPYRQNIGHLCESLVKSGYRVQIETNGTLFRKFNYDGVEVVCSPKTPLLHDDLVPYINAFKYVMDADNVDPEDGLPSKTLMSARPARPPYHLFRSTPPPIYVQPMDVQDPVLNWKNTQACMKSCFTHGYRMSVQIHKTLGLE